MHAIPALATKLQAEHAKTKAFIAKNRKKFGLVTPHPAGISDRAPIVINSGGFSSHSVPKIDRDLENWYHPRH